MFTRDVVYELADSGRDPLVGVAAVAAAAAALGDANPVAHHVTDVVVTEAADGSARVRSKGLAVRADGSCGSVSYDDTAVRTGDGWRISRRTVSARRTPLSGPPAPPAPGR
ncbi:nuclear transport factor 2 family protein [Streptomyces tremellae]|uniref:SnoaL-like domain-containing protein n=1 Tax=Streptomyces tremellae TaxID=1124239 RepID=A0ABP7FYH3_9ACTN